MAKVEGLVGIREFSKLESYFAGLAEESSQAEAIEARLEEWRFLLKALESSGAAEFVEIDLGIVRGLAYYTGFVFEAFEASGEGRALAGGGRYDDLVGKLGSQPMPAVGFAMGDVTLGDLLEKKGLLEEAECGPRGAVTAKANHHASARFSSPTTKPRRTVSQSWNLNVLP